jgi:hypothetical protein
MGTMGVEVGGVPGKQTIEVTATEHEREVEDLRAHRAYEPFGVGVGLGARARVRMTLAPSEPSTSSNERVNFESWSRIR